MADWRFRGIRCPRCRNYKREPVNLHQPPHIHEAARLNGGNPTYDQQCHDCSMLGVSQSLAAAYGETWKRLKMVCEQKERGGLA